MTHLQIAGNALLQVAIRDPKCDLSVLASLVLGRWEHNQPGRLQIGLVSMGADRPMDVTSRFDHVPDPALNR